MVARNMVHLDGTLGTAERWSVGLCYAGLLGETVDDPAALQTWADAIETAMVAVTGTPSWKLLLGGYAKITQCRIYHYPASGPADQVATNVFSSPLGQSTTSTKTPQTALCVSLLTGTAGSRRRGRFYWPAAVGTINETTLKVSGIGTPHVDFANLLNLIGDAGPDPIDPLLHVYSPSDNDVTPVTQVRTGDVLDTQRRRRDKLIETYSVANL